MVKGSRGMDTGGGHGLGALPLVEGEGVRSTLLQGHMN